LKAINKQKHEDVKLLAKEEKNIRKCQKESKKWICTIYAPHRGHDDSHRETEAYLRKTEAYLLHRGTM
jgi:hypothetical protein